VVLAVFMLIALNISLYWAAAKVIMLAKRSTALYKNPAYILYSDPSALNKWGFLYVNYRATAYYCVLPFLLYHLLKSLFVGLGQKSYTTQAIALLVIETFVLISVCVLRPWMDKKTNAFNIAIAVVNFIDVILLLFFSNIFHQPGIVTGIMGVIFFVLNVVFAFILLVWVLASSAYAIISKNPDRRYQPMRDDRVSFIKDEHGHPMTAEIDALGAAARDAPGAGGPMMMMQPQHEMHELKSAPVSTRSGELSQSTSEGDLDSVHYAQQGHPGIGAPHPDYPQYDSQTYGQGAGAGQLPSSVPLFPAVSHSTSGGHSTDERFRRSPAPQQQQQHQQQYGGGYGAQPGYPQNPFS
ncbi:hypothetical protein KEM52_002848, partial [Ascosphaera acerosa]